MSTARIAITTAVSAVIMFFTDQHALRILLLRHVLEVRRTLNYV
jgi:hypothetical protein